MNQIDKNVKIARDGKAQAERMDSIWYGQKGGRKTNMPTSLYKENAGNHHKACGCPMFVVGGCEHDRD